MLSSKIEHTNFAGAVTSSVVDGEELLFISEWVKVVTFTSKQSRFDGNKSVNMIRAHLNVFNTLVIGRHSSIKPENSCIYLSMGYPSNRGHKQPLWPR